MAAHASGNSAAHLAENLRDDLHQAAGHLRDGAVGIAGNAVETAKEYGQQGCDLAARKAGAMKKSTERGSSFIVTASRLKTVSHIADSPPGSVPELEFGRCRLLHPRQYPHKQCVCLPTIPLAKHCAAEMRVAREILMRRRTIVA